MKKISIIGAGNIGSVTAMLLSLEEAAQEIVLLDIIEGMPIGKALDILQLTPLYGVDINIIGTNDVSDIQDSDIVIVTSGVPRKPGMSREDLINVNAQIIKDVAGNIKKYAPNSIVIVVTNPLDAMTYLMYKVTGFPREKVIGMAGVLDSTRFRLFLAKELKVSINSVNGFVLGSHGDTMVPSLAYTTVGGVGIKELLPKDQLDKIIERTRNAGGEIVAYLKTGSAFFAPSASVVKMVKAILKDKKELVPCSVYLQGEYGLEDLVMGVPVILGKGGAEKIVEVKLPEEEYNALKVSAEAIKKSCQELYQLGIL